MKTNDNKIKNNSEVLDSKYGADETSEPMFRLFL